MVAGGNVVSGGSVVTGGSVVAGGNVVTGGTVVTDGAAVALIERSRFPEWHLSFWHANALRRMWYGEPLIELAAFPSPQSAELAICPPHAITAVECVAVKYTLISFLLSLPGSPVGTYSLGFALMVHGYDSHRLPTDPEGISVSTAVNVAPYAVNTPSTWLIPLSAGSLGIGIVEGFSSPHTRSSHGTASAML